MRHPCWPRLALLLSCALGAACHREQPAFDADQGVDTDMYGPGSLVITPADPVIIVAAGQPAPPMTFTATLAGQPVSPQWSTTRPELGSISSAGVYLPTGSLGGKALIEASFGGLHASTGVTVQLHVVENGDPKCGNAGPIGPGGYGGVGGNGPGCPASPAEQTALAGGGVPDGAVDWLYPYDATVFPRGLLAPLLMWTSGSHDFQALSIHMEAKSGTYFYDGTFAKPAGKPFINLPLPQQTWTTMNYSSSGDDVTITVKLYDGAAVVALPTRTWRIAAGTLKGIVYYNSYGTALVTNSEDKDFDGNDFGAGTLGIKPGVTDPVLIAGKPSADMSGCRVCHSVSKDGAQLITQRGDNNYKNSVLVDLKNGNSESALPQLDTAFPAISPDGKKFFSSSGGMRNGDSTSRLYALPGGALIASPPGLPADLRAALPAFSPDGTRLAFTRFAGAGGDGRSLGVMSFADATNTFGVVENLVTPPGTQNAVWPSFLPTNAAVVYETEIVTSQFGHTRNGATAQLWWVDVATKQARALDRLNGVGYLPKGPSHMADQGLNYEPTVNPVASGGYAWVVFTSRRLYGNVATIDPWRSDPRNYPWKSEITTKKLWVAAIDLNAQPGTDPSHPAFYLPAQELHAGNSRGFWAVDPCRPDGYACETGDECCGGYCQMSAAPDMGPYVCSSEKPECAKEFERCVSDADCCPSTGVPSPDPTPGGAPALSCINGYCVAGSPPVL